MDSSQEKGSEVVGATLAIDIRTDSVIGQYLETLPSGHYSILGRYGYVLASPTTTRLETTR